MILLAALCFAWFARNAVGLVRDRCATWPDKVLAVASVPVFAGMMALVCR